MLLLLKRKEKNRRAFTAIEGKSLRFPKPENRLVDYIS